MMERIDFEITQLSAEKPQEVIEAYIALHDDYIEYNVKYYSDEKDEDLGIWNKGTYHEHIDIGAKEAVKGVQLSYRNKLDQWKVLISINGVSEDFFVMFENEEKAKTLFYKIKEWKFPSSVK